MVVQPVGAGPFRTSELCNNKNKGPFGASRHPFSVTGLPMARHTTLAQDGEYHSEYLRSSPIVTVQCVKSPHGVKKVINGPFGALGILNTKKVNVH